MMLLTLTILLPLVHSAAGTVCHAEPMKIVNTSTLLEPILEQLEKQGAIIWNNQTSLATYYKGFPDVHNSNRQFIAACAGGLENRDFHNCVNATWIDGKEGGRNINITAKEFLKFYNECKIEAGLDKPKEEDEDDYDKEKNEVDEELEELKEAAEGRN